MYFFGGNHSNGFTKEFRVHSKGGFACRDEALQVFYGVCRQAHLYELRDGVGMLAKRSVNATFNGIGAPKTIVLTETLLQQLGIF